ncbi:3-deoxy-manno-octulosonate cytidylyltransferase [bacterium]|nr:3-deoxy-manno-octulosonate cytidylyltransferase [bacterium]
MPRIACVIPARWGSTRLPGKMLADVAGKPLIVRTWETVNSAKIFDTVLVATDNERIRDAIKVAGGNAVMTDPELPSGSDRVLAALEGIDADIVANVQGDEPLLPAEVIRKTTQLLVEREDFGVTTAACPLSKEHLQIPDIVKVTVDNFQRALYFSRAPIPFARSKKPNESLFRRHIGLYVYRREILEKFCSWDVEALEECESLEQLRLLAHGVAIGVADVGEIPPGVDTIEDLHRIRVMFDDR